MRLTNEQELWIINVVKSENLAIPTLEADLIDHLCCEAEAGLDEGLAFEDAVRKALQMVFII